jgi:hypothetical protein
MKLIKDMLSDYNFKNEFNCVDKYNNFFYSKRV